MLTCPLFFSGIVFSTLLSAESRISSVMSMNLMGAMCGGILEYNSMYFGFHFLYLLAIGLYAAAFLSGPAVSSPRRLPAFLAGEILMAWEAALPHSTPPPSPPRCPHPP